MSDSSSFDLLNLIPKFYLLFEGDYSSAYGLAAGFVTILFVVTALSVIFCMIKFMQASRHLRFYRKLLNDVNPEELLNTAGLEDDNHFLAPQIPRILPPLFQAVVKPRGSAGPYANPLMNISFDTYFYVVPEQIIARCADFNDEVDYLEVRVVADPTDPRADDYAAEFNGGETWGLHLADMNLVMDDLIALAQRQIDVYKTSFTEGL